MTVAATLYFEQGQVRPKLPWAPLALPWLVSSSHCGLGMEPIAELQCLAGIKLLGAFGGFNIQTAQLLYLPAEPAWQVQPSGRLFIHVLPQVVHLCQSLASSAVSLAERCQVCWCSG